MRTGKITSLFLTVLCLLLVVVWIPVRAETESAGTAEENTIPTPILWNNHPDAGVRIDNQEGTIKLTAKTDVANHLPGAFTFDPDLNAPRSDLKDDRFSFDFVLSDWKTENGVISADTYLVFSFRVSEASMAPWSASFGMFLLIFPDKVQFRLNDGSPDENEAFYLYLNDVHFFDGESHHVDIRIDDEEKAVTIQLDNNADYVISHIADDDRTTSDEFDADGGNMFFTHYVTAEISNIIFINSKEAPVIDPGDLIPGGVEEDETQMRAPNPVQPQSDTWKIVLIVAAGVVALGAVGFGYYRLLKKQ